MPLRLAPTRVLALLVVAAVVAAMTFWMDRAEAVISTPFTAVYSANANGSIVLRGNTNLTCPATAATCADARNGSATTADQLDNNFYAMTNLDVDSDDSTFNSSTTQLSLPPGSTVLFAGLYWSADVSAGTGGSAAPSAADDNRVKFSVPGTPGYSDITATRTPYVSGNAYQGYANVTSMVAGAGNGTYAVGNIQAGTGQDRYAGWALVVAYQNAAENMRNLRIYDGFGAVSSSSTSVDIPVNGFQTPQSGTVTTKIGTVVYEGDLGTTGDTLQLDGTSMSDAVNPATNFFNSTVSDGGTRVTSRNPSSANLMGVDIDQFDATGRLGHNVNAATLTLTTGGETFYPGVVTFTTDLYAPNLTATMTGTDVDGGDLLPGDTLEYAVDVVNDGTDTAISSVLNDAVPTHTTYVPGSLSIAGAGRTDTAADDTADFGSSATTFRLGAGATATDGGELAPAATTRVTFRVTVDADTAPGTLINNIATVGYVGKNTGRAIAGTSSAAPVTVARPHADLAAALTVAPSIVQRDGTDDAVSYVMTVTNNGPGIEPAAWAGLTLPAGVTVGSLPTGCTAAGAVVRCPLGVLTAGASASVTVPATANATAGAAANATAVASGLGTDDVAGNDSAAATLTVNTAPTAVGDSAQTDTGTPVDVPVLANDSDPDGPHLTSAVAVQPAHGAVVANPDGTVTYTPDAAYAGPDSFTYTVNDGAGASANGTVSITVRNAPPVAGADTEAGPAGLPVTVPVLANDTDPNGDPLTVTGVGPAGPAGSVTFTGTAVTFTPAAGFGGNATFTYTVSDGHGGTAVGHVTVAVANARPVAAADTFTTAYGVDKVLNVLGNDSDPNSDPLGVQSVSQPDPAQGTVDLTGGVVTFRPAAGFSGTATFTYVVTDGTDSATGTVHVDVADAAPVADQPAVSGPYGVPQVIDVLTHSTDPNHDTLTVVGVTAPAHGSAVLRADGRIGYTPDAGFSGTDGFDFTVDDGRGGRDTGHVTVTVANAPPVAAPVSVTAEANQPLAVHVPVTDANGDPLTVTVDSSPAHGTVAVAGDGTVTYTPAPGYRGPDSFHYTVTDGHGGTDGANVTVAVVNSAPTAHDDADQTDTDTPLTVSVLANDTDPSGDPLTVTAFTQGGHGTVTADGSGHLRYVPDAGFQGLDAFTYTVADGQGGTAGATVRITVNDAPPIAVADTLPVQAGVGTRLYVMANDTDPNVGAVLHVVSVTAGHQGLVSVGPGGAWLTYVPDLGSSGIDTFDYTIADELGLMATATVTVAVNHPPAAVTDTASTAGGTAVSVPVLANDSDPEHAALHVRSVGTPAHGTAVAQPDGTIRYTPDASFVGTDTFTYVAADTAGGTATGTVTVTVGNTRPVATPDVAAVAENGRVDIPVLANDADVNTGQTLTVQSLHAPAHGTAAVRPDGRIRYTPAAGWTGTDSFTYVVSDQHGGTATGTVTVTVSGGAPVALADHVATPYQHAVVVHPLTNDLHAVTITGVGRPDHGTVTFTAHAITYHPPAGWSGVASFTYTADSASTATVSVTVGAPPVVPDRTAAARPGNPVTIGLPLTDEHHRPVTVTAVGTAGHGTVRLLSGGRVVYTAATGFAGTDSFTYTATDADGNVATATVQVTVAGPNHPPVARNDAASVAAGRSARLKPLANDTDRDHDRIRITSLGQPRHGTAVLNADGSVTYAPRASYQGGSDSFAYTITDGKGRTARATVTITVVPGSTTTKLPKTGADVMSVVGAGVLTLLVGGILYGIGMGGRAVPAPAWAGSGRTGSASAGSASAGFASAGVNTADRSPGPWILSGRRRGPGRHRPGKHRR